MPQFYDAVLVVSFGGPEGPDFVASFSPSQVLSGGLLGGAGIAFAFALASFIGFEATAIYGEETLDPKRAVPRATYIAVITLGVFYTFAAYAALVGFGEDVHKHLVNTAVQEWNEFNKTVTDWEVRRGFERL